MLQCNNGTTECNRQPTIEAVQGAGHGGFSQLATWTLLFHFIPVPNGLGSPINSRFWSHEWKSYTDRQLENQFRMLE